MITLPARFWAKVDKTETCWLWTASLDHGGYGKFNLKGLATGAHRIAYLALVGPIPDGLSLDHLCRVRNCVNPAHLEPVSHQENVARSPLNPNRKTHCPRGHEYAGPNLVLEPRRRGGVVRKCRTCCNERRRKRPEAGRVRVAS